MTFEEFISSMNGAPISDPLYSLEDMKAAYNAALIEAAKMICANCEMGDPATFIDGRWEHKQTADGQPVNHRCSANAIRARTEP